MAIAVRGSYSPWGKIQYTKTIADGIVFVSTSSHGGIKLSRQRQFEMPNSLRVKGGWYEEDCECSLVVLGFPQYFDKDQKEHAVKSVKNWFPEKYEEFTGTFIPVEESIVKNNKKFEQENINNYVAVAAWGDWHERVPQGMVAVLAKKANDEKFFLVPAKEYTGRFVIDLNKYKEIKFLP